MFLNAPIRWCVHYLTIPYDYTYGFIYLCVLRGAGISMAKEMIKLECFQIFWRQTGIKGLIFRLPAENVSYYRKKKRRE